jgi:hypothetical protein
MALAWQGVQERGVGHLERRLGLEVFRLPLLATEEFGLPEVDVLARLLADARPSASRGSVSA